MPGIYCEQPCQGPDGLPPGEECLRPQAGALQGQVKPGGAAVEGRQAGQERLGETAAGLT